LRSLDVTSPGATSDGLHHIVCHAKSGKPGGVATPQSATVNAGMRNRLLAVNALNNNDDGTHEPNIMGARVPMPRRTSVLRTGFDKLKTRCIHHGQGSSSSRSHDTMASNHPLQLRLSSIARQWSTRLLALPRAVREEPRFWTVSLAINKFTRSGHSRRLAPPASSCCMRPSCPPPAIC